ncbi:hypothetical protein, conserved [Babesia ovata]|uniref:6-Cys domain-containing protein n=1 Tax=Babesia ovata TaxID=189622 RepID=A0A2H6KGV6_9APIC|nr:uncharacterized protein BOVATA_037150 [Babesia ovata]GBE62222.1 hypothetical protein, conserved [Babesia ovata]
MGRRVGRRKVFMHLTRHGRTLKRICSVDAVPRGSPAQYTWHVLNVNVQTTDPYMQGCGVTYASDELFKPETPQIYDANGQPQFGCKIDIQAAKEAAFYCPAPYLLDPPNCFRQVLVDGTVKNTHDLSDSLVASRSNHFVILSFDSSLVGPGRRCTRRRRWSAAASPSRAPYSPPYRSRITTPNDEYIRSNN